METCNVLDLPNNFGACIQDLSLSELLKLKLAMQKVEENKLIDDLLPIDKPIAEEKASLSNVDQPIALALVGNKRGYSDWDYNQWLPEEENPTKLQTIFQVSITALSFLSFGGYLLCLIVQGIKSKGTTYLYPTAVGGTGTNQNTRFQKIKVYRRSRRAIVHELNDG